MTTKAELAAEVAVIDAMRNGSDLAPRQPGVVTPAEEMNIIARAVDRGMDADSIAKLVGLQERREALRAKQEYTVAMTSVQHRMKPVAKRKQGAKAKYASYEEVDSYLRPLYTEAGFGVDFTEDTCPKDGHVRILMTISHISGHLRVVWGDFPTDAGPQNSSGKSVMTPVQAKASLYSYARRYLLCMGFNVVTCDEDFDGEHAATPPDDPPITPAQVQEIYDFIEGKEHAARVNAWVKQVCGADKLEAIPTSAFPGILQGLQQARQPKPAAIPTGDRKAMLQWIDAKDAEAVAKRGLQPHQFARWLCEYMDPHPDNPAVENWQAKDIVDGLKKFVGQNPVKEASK